MNLDHFQEVVSTVGSEVRRYLGEPSWDIRMEGIKVDQHVSNRYLQEEGEVLNPNGYLQENEDISDPEDLADVELTELTGMVPDGALENSMSDVGEVDAEGILLFPTEGRISSSAMDQIQPDHRLATLFP